jgi:hypothetical protein
MILKIKNFSRNPIDILRGYFFPQRHPVWEVLLYNLDMKQFFWKKIIDTITNIAKHFKNVDVLAKKFQPN